MDGAEKKYTERDLVMAKREGFAAGARRHVEAIPAWFEDDVARQSAERYPLPKVTRPRVVRDPHNPGSWSWRVSASEMFIESRFGDGEWGDNHPPPPTPARMELWVDLFANPTEEVEEES